MYGKVLWCLYGDLNSNEFSKENILNSKVNFVTLFTLQILIFAKLLLK